MTTALFLRRQQSGATGGCLVHSADTSPAHTPVQTAAKPPAQSRKPPGSTAPRSTQTIKAKPPEGRRGLPAAPHGALTTQDADAKANTAMRANRTATKRRLMVKMRRNGAWDGVEMLQLEVGISTMKETCVVHWRRKLSHWPPAMGNGLDKPVTDKVTCLAPQTPFYTHCTR